MKHSIENFIAEYHNIYNDSYCDALINGFEKTLGLGFGFQNADGIYRDDLEAHYFDVLQNSTVNFNHFVNESKYFLDIFWSKVYPSYLSKYKVLEMCDQHAIFSMKVQKSNAGEGYHSWHFDNSKRELNNRLLVFILYLNTVDEGGETEFKYYPKRVKPEKGKLVIFPAGMTHTHRGNPPLTNEKYILTGWVEY